MADGVEFGGVDAAAVPRAVGLARVVAKRRGARSVLADLRQEGSGKAFLPAAHHVISAPGDDASAPLDAVLLNTAGGVTGGDRFRFIGEAGDGSWLRLTTQACERAYRAQPGEVGRLRVSLKAGAGARLDWLPQETILFDGAALSRRLEVDLAPDSRFLAVEPLVFGRAAMGETLSQVSFSDQWRVRRAGKLVFADAVRLDGPAAATLARPATGAGAGAMASVLYVGADAEALVDALTALGQEADGVDAAGGLIRPEVALARLLAPDSRALRRVLKPLLETLGRAPLPKVWMI